MNELQQAIERTNDMIEVSPSSVVVVAKGDARHLVAAAEDLMAYRVLLTGAVASAAAASGCPPIEPFAHGYLEALVEGSVWSGALAAEGVTRETMQRVCEQLHVRMPA